jgi:hypothetical protein
VARLARLLPLTLLASLALCGPAAAIDRYVPMKGVPAAGPAKYERVFVQQLGARGAERVLVLIPGFFGGAGSITPVARDIVRRVDDLQVWIVDRRENAFEDTSGFRRGDPAEAQDYYLGRFAYRGVRGQAVPYVGRWGLRVALGDLRRVVLRARAGGRREVILGGHSLGASTNAAYASWDFGGRPGHRDIAGMVLIDGGPHGAFASAGVDRARRVLAEIRSGAVFDDLLGLGLPEINGIFTQVAALWALKRPDEPSVLQRYPLLPDIFKPPVPVTNEAELGFAFDADTSPPGFELIRINAGGLAYSGDPRPWVDGELTPIRRFARAFAAERPNAAQWYFSRRLRLDVDAMDPLERTPATRLLGLRPMHANTIDVPLYAYETDLTGGGVARGARSLVRTSDIPRARIVADPSASHLDPLAAAPARNRFLKTVVPFLRRVAGR